MPENFVKTEKLDSAYRLVIVAAKRSKELQRGAPLRVESPARKHTTLAIQEVKAGKVEFKNLDRRVPGAELETT